MRKDCSEQEINSRQGPDACFGYRGPYNNAQPQQIGILLALKAGRQIELSLKRAVEAEQGKGERP
jgi:hypothetical protein